MKIFFLKFFYTRYFSFSKYKVGKYESIKIRAKIRSMKRILPRRYIAELLYKLNHRRFENYLKKLERN